ncbi:MAG: MarR family transcriptional regulator [Actinomycetota bacterium]|nr:MarR family transcriptional regulator [Actinomycetota bacterium]
MSRSPWLSRREQRAWRTFLTMQRRLSGRVARELQRETGLSGADYEVLVNLSEAPEGRLRAFQLGMVTGWEKSRLSHHITRMEDRALVRRASCPTDNRGAYVVLTAEGRKAIEAAAPLHVEHVRRWFVDALTADQLDALADISDTILAELGDDPDPCSSP